jgi:hypothetical protein
MEAVCLDWWNDRTMRIPLTFEGTDESRVDACTRLARSQRADRFLEHSGSNPLAA